MKYLPVFLLLFLTACESLVNTIPEGQLPLGEPQLTMFCYISPQDTVIRAKVSMSNPAFGVYNSNGQSYYIENGDTIRTDRPLTTATVTISDGEATARLSYQKLNEVYELSTKDFPVRAGGTYTLTVSEGGKTARATCTIPMRQVPIKSFRLDSTETDNSFGNVGKNGKKLAIDFTWDDPTGEPNYYRVNVYEVLDVPSFIYNPADTTFTETRRIVTNYFRIDRQNFRSTFQNDKNIDGTTFSSPLFEHPSSLDNYNTILTVNGKVTKPSRGPERIGVYLLLNNTDQPYFDFHRSLERYQNDNPFTEPSLLYTNVEGGLGAFGGYNQTVKEIKF